MANITSINGNPIVAMEVSDDASALLQGAAKVRGMTSYEVVYGKYVTTGTNSQLVIADKSGMGYVHIDGSDAAGKIVELTAAYPNTTYNVNMVQVLSDDSTKLSRTSNVSSVYRKLILVDDDSTDVYVNFMYSNGVVCLDLSVNHSLAAKHGYALHVCQPFEYDPIAHTITIQNYRNTEWSGAEGEILSIGVQYDDVTAVPFSSSHAPFTRTISNVVSGFFYYDIAEADFGYHNLYSFGSDSSTKVVIAEFYNGVMNPPDAMRTIDNSMKHSGKSIRCFGDSLTWYDGKNATWGPYLGETIIGYETYISTFCNAVTYNHGVSGQTIPEICSRIVSGNDAKDCDILIIMGGDNDDRRDVSVGTLLPYGSTFDTTTTIGALQNAVENVLSNNPRVVIALVTEPMGWTWDSSLERLARVDEKYPNAIRRVAEHYGLPLLDLWNTSGVNEMTRNTMYLDPPDTENQQYMYHPSNYGWKVISERMVKFVQSL